MDPAVRRQLQTARLKLSPADQRRLEEVCAKQGVPAELVRDLLIVEDDLSQLKRRHDVFTRLGEVVAKHAGGA